MSADFCDIERRSDLFPLNDKRNCENGENAKEQNDANDDGGRRAVSVWNDLPDFFARQDEGGHDGDEAEDRRRYHNRNEKVGPEQRESDETIVNILLEGITF